MRPRLVISRTLAAAVPVWTLVALAFGPSSSAIPAGEIEGFSASLEIERTLLHEDLERHGQAKIARADVATRIVQLQQALDAAIELGELGSPERIHQLADQLLRAEADRQALAIEAHVLAKRLGDRIRRIALLEQKLAALSDRDQPPEGRLTGSWDLSLMPQDQRGVCVLQQSGAVVSGTYELSGGFSGSVQGTLVNRKVFLVRIDSKLGKSMEFEGYLAADGASMRGTWLSYELAGSAGATGQWLARRRAAEP